MNRLYKSWLSGASIGIAFAVALSGCVPVGDAGEDSQTLSGRFTDVASDAPVLEATAPALVKNLNDEPLVNMGSGKCFEPTPQGGASGLPIQQHGCNDDVTNDDGTLHTANLFQFYRFESVGNVPLNDHSGWPCWGCIDQVATGYLIKSSKSVVSHSQDPTQPEECLDARDGAKTDSSVVQQWECRGTSARSMLWYVEAGDFPGTFRVRNFNSDLCLDVRAGSWDDGAQLQQYHCTKSNLAQTFSQKFPANWSVNLNGRWTDGSSKSAVITQQYPAIAIDMSAWNRPAARGWFSADFTITVNFPDGGTFTGDVSTPNRIKWSNGSSWVHQP